MRWILSVDIENNMINQKFSSSLLSKRYRKDRRFKFYAVASIFFTLTVLVILLGSITTLSIPAFTRHEVTLDIMFDAEQIEDECGDSLKDCYTIDWMYFVYEAVYKYFPDVQMREDQRRLRRLFSIGASKVLREAVMKDMSLIGQTVSVDLPVSDDADLFLKGEIDRDLPQADRLVSDPELIWIDKLVSDHRIKRRFSWFFFTSGDSREPELAGLWGAMVGSFLTIIVTFLVSFPIGVLTALYLEEFAPKNRLTYFIEVNINNLAAVPSIVYGLLGLTIFIIVFDLPRSAPLVGGLVLALMTMPTIIIASRAALQSVPFSIRQAALGIGASPMQVIFHHVLPLATPGILTGTIIGLAQAAGETAPLLLIGMMAFVADIPGGFTEGATVLPAQIFMWANSSEQAFRSKTAAAIIVLVGFLLMMNALALYLRKHYEKKW